MALVSRRSFILGGGAFVIGLGAFASVLALRPTLDALVDTIVPADAFGPAASETGAADAVWASLEGSRQRMRFRLGMAWLNWRAGGSFAAADPEERAAIVAELAGSRPDTHENGFYRLVRTQTMRHYYGDATRAVALGFPGAPQPEGFADPAASWIPRA